MMNDRTFYPVPEAVWFSSLPKTWQAVQMQQLFSERSTKVSDKDFAPLTVGYMGIVPQLANVAKTDNGDNRKLIKKGDFAINSRSDRKGAGGISEYDGSCSVIITVLKPHNELNGRFYHYLLRSHYFSEEFYRNGYGIVDDLWSTKWKTMRTIYLPVPPCEEQNQIVHFLDWKVSEINRLINIKRKEIEQLEELKKAVVSHAVTRGLNSTVAMKSSGANWLGDIPAHWNIVKLRQILHPVSVKNRPELPLLSVVREQGVIIRDVDDKKANHNYIPDDLSNYKMVCEGQFAMNKMKAWQGSYGISPYTGIVSPAYFIFDTAFENLEYFHYAIRSKVYVNFFAQASDGIRVGQWDLQMDKMKEIPFFVPPVDEQKAIVEYIKTAIPQYEDAIEKFSKQIERLRECQTCLISDVVTGKIDVRGIEIPEYEYISEETDEMMKDKIDDTEEKFYEE